MTNFEMLLSVVDSLRFSQGFYSRLYQNIMEDYDNVKEYVNNLEIKFKDSLDVILWLEQ